MIPLRAATRVDQRWAVGPPPCMNADTAKPMAPILPLLRVAKSSQMLKEVGCSMGVGRGGGVLTVETLVRRHAAGLPDP
jgi:hypothetical protein